MDVAVAWLTVRAWIAIFRQLRAPAAEGWRRCLEAAVWLLVLGALAFAPPIGSPRVAAALLIEAADCAAVCALTWGCPEARSLPRARAVTPHHHRLSMRSRIESARPGVSACASAPAAS